MVNVKRNLLKQDDVVIDMLRKFDVQHASVKVKHLKIDVALMVIVAKNDPYCETKRNIM